MGLGLYFAVDHCLLNLNLPKILEDYFYISLQKQSSTAPQVKDQGENSFIWVRDLSEFCLDKDVPPPKARNQLSFSPHHWYVHTNCGVWLGSKGFLFLIKEGEKIPQIGMDSEFESLLSLEKRFLWQAVLTVFFRNVEYYPLHCNVCIYNDQGILLVGRAGSGKTTLSLSLIQESWQYSADDTNLLYECEGQVYTSGLRRGFACTAETLTRFPKLAELPVLYSAENKQVVDIVYRYSDQYVSSCKSKVVIYPKITSNEASKLVPINQKQALPALIPHSPGIIGEQKSAKAQFKLLAKLVQQTRSFELHLGDDSRSDNKAVLTLLDEAISR